jgi:formate hydrogenlyase transcriptional activator
VGIVARAERRNFKFEKRFESDGTTIWLNLYVSLVEETSGSPRCLMALVEDVSEQKRAEASMREELRHDRDLLGFILDLGAAAGDLARSGHVSAVKETPAPETFHLHEESPQEQDPDEIIGRGHGLRHALKQVETVATTDATVLLLGETGTGKELIARAIHKLSARRKKPLVRADCASIPAGLLENELFGHEKGAFTGAIAREMGRLELANDGTLFLDEVGDIPLDVQSKLLRALQEREFERLGSTRTIRANFRLVAATNRDLGQMVEQGHFRRDLFYRINVFPIQLPALRERKEDIPLLVRHFVKKYARRMSKGIETIRRDDMDVLTHYPWPGNVRELQNVIERSVVLSPGTVLHLSAPAAAKPKDESALLADQTLQGSEREHILQALRNTDWVIGGPYGAAARLGVRRTTLLYKMHRLGITRPS